MNQELEQIGVVEQSWALPTGTLVGGFVIKEVMGAGGFGFTYKAWDELLQRFVVIKENYPLSLASRAEGSHHVCPKAGVSLEEYEWARANFLREARTLASLDHEHIVPILSIFEEGGTAYFVMPFLEGATLEYLISRRQSKNQAFVQEEILGLLTRLLEALNYLHLRDIFHRDIKPDNIFVTQKGLPILIDFGSARRLDTGLPLTIVESVGYSPPEQSFSEGNHGPWSDLYSLGAVMHRMMAGQAPRLAAQRRIKDPNPPLSQCLPLYQLYSQSLLVSVDKALSLEVEERYKAGDEWLGDIWELLPKA